MEYMETDVPDTIRYICFCIFAMIQAGEALLRKLNSTSISTVAR